MMSCGEGMLNGHRGRVERTLPVTASDGEQRVAGVVVLDALRHGVETELGYRTDDALEQRLSAVRVDVAQKAAVELHDVDGGLTQVAQRAYPVP